MIRLVEIEPPAEPRLNTLKAWRWEYGFIHDGLSHIVTLAYMGLVPQSITSRRAFLWAEFTAEGRRLAPRVGREVRRQFTALVRTLPWSLYAFTDGPSPRAERVLLFLGFRPFAERDGSVFMEYPDGN